MEREDQLLVKGILQGDKVSLKKFERQYRQRLINFVLQKARVYEDAEEIVQETLISAYYSLPSFLGQSSLWSWLCGVAKHETADFYRKKKIKEVLFSRFPALDRLVGRALSPETALQAKEIEEKILACFWQLAEGYREVLRLKYTEGLSLLQISRQLKKTVKAVEMKLRRARYQFADYWNGQKHDSKNSAALDPGNISFFKEYLGLVDPPLQDPAGH